MNIEKRLELARIKLYYKIGILDYYMAFGNFKITEENRDSIISNLRERAELSVMLQILEEEMFDLGLNPTNDLVVIKDIPEYLPRLPENENYVQNFDKENIGKKDEKGKYYLKDGVVYWAFEKSQAKKFTKDNNIILCHNPHRSDVMDITYYADFVDTRDSTLQNKYKKISKFGIPLPSIDTSYCEYLKALKNAKSFNI